MRILMMGTGGFAVPTFAGLLDSPHHVATLVTQPARPVHGRRREPANPMRELAEARGVPVVEMENVNDRKSVEQLAACDPELLVVCDFGQILAPETLGVAVLGGINLHGSLLPQYRGAAPVNWALYDGQTVTGVTVIHMTPKLDAGPCLTKRQLAISPDETAVELELRLARIGVGAVSESIQMLAGWDRRSALGIPQDPAQATRAPRLKKSDGLVDWTRTSLQLFNQVRALKPWPNTFTHWLRADAEPLRLILHEVSTGPPADTSVQPGTVVSTDEGRLLIATGDDTLAIDSAQPAGRRVLEAAELLRGYPVHAGEKFG